MPFRYPVIIITRLLYYKSDLIRNLQELFVLSDCTYITPFFDENFDRGKEPTIIFVETFCKDNVLINKLRKSTVFYASIFLLLNNVL